MVLGVTLIICYVVPYTVLLLIPLIIYFYILRKYFLSSSREIKRFEASSRSPIYSAFSASLNGLITIRAFGISNVWRELFNTLLENNAKNYVAFITTSRWLGFRLDVICACILLFVSFFAVSIRMQMNPGLVGFMITASIQLAGLYQWSVRQSAEFANIMTSTERALAYSKLVCEKDNKKIPPAGWPHCGSIDFKNVFFRYRDDLDFVLNNFNVSIKGNQTIGIVGRTGAGKSSITQALFRIVECAKGNIFIDNLDISEYGLDEVRNKISIIPQEPLLFNGTVRFNLDPFNKFESDELLYDALKAVQMDSHIEQMGGLTSIIAEFGSNFSVGQKQLMCLARAILLNNKIVVLDEATANVDLNTDLLIQKTISTRFVNATRLIIAHRIQTIVKCDKILVMDQGKAVEFDTPLVLLSKKDSIFSSLVHQSEAQLAHKH